MMERKQVNKLQGESKNWRDKLKEAADKYSYQEALTTELDRHEGDFTDITLLKIVLWKLNRYPAISSELLEDINILRKDYNEERAKTLLKSMLETKGFDLPMASTVLRFVLPNKFQIIDKRVCRIIMPAEDTLKLPHNTGEKIQLYFKYLERLKLVCSQYGIPFENCDRILYQLDKIVNKEITIDY